MTIQEAIKSGKRFKRKGLVRWLEEKFGGFFLYLPNGWSKEYSLKPVDIIADDWEVEGES